MRTNDTTSLIGRPAVPETVVVLPTSESERTRSQQYTLNASARYQFDARTSGTATYAFGLTDQEDTPTSYSNSGGLGVFYELTSLDSISLNPRLALHGVLGRIRPGVVLAPTDMEGPTVKRVLHGPGSRSE